MLEFCPCLKNGLIFLCKKNIFLFFLFLQFSANIFAQPTIESFSPASGPVGTTVTILGKNFSSNSTENKVFFGRVRANLSVSASTTRLTVTVPPGATFEPITVSVGGLTAYAEKPFIVTFFGAAPEFSPAPFEYMTRVDSVNSDVETTKYSIGDLDGDGSLDVVTIDALNSKMTFYSNNTILNEVSFAKKGSFATGAGPRCVTVADIDSDGRLDVIVTNFKANTVSVFRNVGFGIFAQKVDFATAFQPSEIAVADIDKDGKPDLVINTINLEGYVSVLRNTGSFGNISFAPKIDLQSFGGSIERITVGDLDGDGKRDIAVPNFLANTISIFRNTSTAGNINFAAKIDIPTGQYPYDVAIADLNDDGKPDMSVHYFLVSDNVSLYRNTSTSGSISFENPNHISTGYITDAMTVSDFNGDGKPDLALQSFGNFLSLLKNSSLSSGPIQFSTAKKVRMIWGGPLYAGDFDVDGKPDITFDGGLFRVLILKNQTHYPQIASFAPLQAKAGDTVTIAGVNFSSATNVKFGGTPAASFTITNATMIKAVVGAGSTGSVSVSSFNRTHSLEGFVFAAPPTITSFSPASGATGAGITIKGLNFIGVNGVSFGGTPANYFTIVNDSTIIAYISTGTSGDVKLTNAFGTASLPGFLYIPPLPTITSFTPVVAGSGTTIRITGTNFTGATVVSFGGVNASFNVINPTTINAVVASGASGNVAVTTPVGTASLPGFTYIPPPSVSSFTPASAATGKTITITGKDFAYINSVSFGGVPASSFTVVSATTITAVVGAGSSGNVVVTSSFGKGSLAGFVYLPPPTITSFSPRSGPPGTIVTIIGNNLGKVTSMSFSGTRPTSFTIVNDNTITAVAGLGTTGQIYLYSPDGSCSSGSFTFEYAAPTITSFTPATGTTGTRVTITGTNFTSVPVVDVYFGDKYASSIVVNSATMITATVGAGASGNVSVITHGGIAELPGFTYIPLPPSITSIHPSTASQGTLVTIYGDRFNDATSVTFGGVPAPFLVNSNTNITAIVQAGASGEIAITTAGGTGIYSRFTFSALKIESFTPVVGTAGTPVTINGSGFSERISSVKFGGVQASSFAVNSPTQITAVVGAGASGYVEVNDAAKPGFIFASSNTVINSVSPLIAGSGIAVNINGYNFEGATSVKFGDVAASSFTVNSPTSITAIVGNGASGAVSVTSPGGTASFDGFIFTTAPVISSFSRASGAAGSAITIHGANFNPVAENNTVYFGGVKASVIAASATSLNVLVPYGSVFDYISVTNSGLTGYSLKRFTTTFLAVGSLGPASFDARIDSAAVELPKHLAICDIDVDRKPDLSVAKNSYYNPIDKVSIFRNKGVPDTIAFAPQQLLANPKSASMASFADFDGDGKQDIFFGNVADGAAASVFKNNSDTGNISFGTELALYNNLGPFYIAAGDLNGDGKPEIIVGGANTFLKVQKNTSSNGVISFDQALDIGLGGSFISVADIDMDGKPDIITAQAGSAASYGEVRIYRNTSTAGKLSFAPPITYPNVGIGGENNFVGDIDGDGLPDIAVANEYSRTISIFRNNSSPGTIKFDSRIDYFSDKGPKFLTMADLDGNGKPEILVANVYAANISLFNNTSTNGTISLEQRFDYETGQAPKCVAVGDMDLDGKPDIVVANETSGTVSFFRNKIKAYTITSFTPMSGVNGTVVTITGANLIDVTGVSFGGIPAASFTINSSTTITAVVGAGASGDISLNTPFGILTVGGFRFISAPTITSFTPTSGGASATITITGTNFTGATAVGFGGTAATSFAVNSPTSITAIVGAGASGNVSVTTPGGTATRAGFTFTVVTAIDPVPASSLGIRFYPNPTTGSFVIDTLKLSDRWETLEIFDTQGKQKLSNFTIRNKTRVNVNVEYLSNGLYMAILKRRSGPATVIKFLKR